MSVIDDLELKVLSLKSQLSAAEKSLYKARLEKLCLVSRETVLVKNDREYLFSHASYFSNYDGRLEACVHGNPKNKSGKWRANPTFIGYGWRIKP